MYQGDEESSDSGRETNAAGASSSVQRLCQGIASKYKSLGKKRRYVHKKWRTGVASVRSMQSLRILM